MTSHADEILRAFDSVRRRSPGSALAVSPGRTWTVDDVDRLARRLAPRVAAAVATDGGPVALQVADGPAFLAALLAVLRARAVAILLDSRSRVAEVERIAMRLEASCTLVCSEGWPEELEAFRVVSRPGGAPIQGTRRPVSVVKLTSGTTGAPRGVAVSSEALVVDVDQIRSAMGVLDEDRMLAALPFAHSYGLASLALPSLIYGTPLLFVGGRDSFDPLGHAVTSEATVFPTVPAYLGAHLSSDDPPPVPASLRLVISAGAPLPPDVASRFRRRHGQAVHVFYGTSETGGIAYDPTGTAGERGTVGSAIEGVHIEPLPAGPAPSGRRIVVRSAAVGERYLPEPEASLDGGRFVTGDLAVREGDEIRLVGRVRGPINVRGYKVDPAEVEAVIAAHPEVTDVRVIEVRRAANGEPAVRAVVAGRHESLDQYSLREWCRLRLSDYKIPRSFVVVPRLPTDARGKVAREALERLTAETAEAND